MTIAATLRPAALAVPLAEMAPRQAETLAESLVRRSGAALSVKASTFRFPADGPVYEVVEFAVDGGDVVAARAALAQMIAPASVEDIEGWLAVLSVSASRARSTDAEDDLRLAVYTRNLRTLPADVARWVTTEKTWRWWPSWDEMLEAANRRWPRRRAMRDALAEVG